MTEPWFDPIRFGVLYGGIGGSALGVLGGILGAASGYLAPRGKGRSLILGAFTTLLIVGVCDIWLWVCMLIFRVSLTAYGIHLSS